MHASHGNAKVTITIQKITMGWQVWALIAWETSVTLSVPYGPTCKNGEGRVN